MLATLQRIAAIMDAEDLDAAPLLGPGVAGALAEDVSQYLKQAVAATENSSADTAAADTPPDTRPGRPAARKGSGH